MRLEEQYGRIEQRSGADTGRNREEGSGRSKRADAPEPSRRAQSWRRLDEPTPRRPPRRYAPGRHLPRTAATATKIRHFSGRIFPTLSPIQITAASYFCCFNRSPVSRQPTVKIFFHFKYIAEFHFTPLEQNST